MKAGAFAGVLLSLSSVACRPGAGPPNASASGDRPSSPPPAAFSPQRWLDSTCNRFADSLRVTMRRVPDSVKLPDSLALEVGFFQFGSYYHPEGPLGVGILQSGVQGVEGMVPEWPCGVFVPLYDAPAGHQWGWFTGGRVARRELNWMSPLNRLPTITIGQSENALLVHEARRDGWLRVRYYWPSNNTGDGTAWVHQSQLALGAVPLRYVSWEEYLVNRPWPLFVFRDRGAHALYAGPDSGSRVIDRPKGQYAVRALEVRGDWMRVHVQRTSGVCIDPRKPEPADTGWIVWRSPHRGLLLWTEAWDC